MFQKETQCFQKMKRLKYGPKENKMLNHRRILIYEIKSSKEKTSGDI